MGVRGVGGTPLAVVGRGVGVAVGRGVGDGEGVGEGAEVGEGEGEGVTDAAPGVAAGRRMTSTAGVARRGFRSFTFSRYLIAGAGGSTWPYGLRESDRSIFHPEGSRTIRTSRVLSEETTRTVATSPSPGTTVTSVTSGGGTEFAKNTS